MKPASRSGMMVDMPSPAGVIAPVRLIPTVTSYDLHGLARAVGDVQQVEILGGDLALPRDAVAQPPGEPLPVLQAEQDDREVFHLARLDQRERFEQLVHRAVTTRKHDEGGRILHEHRLADEEVAEVDGALDVG